MTLKTSAEVAELLFIRNPTILKPLAGAEGPRQAYPRSARRSRRTCFSLGTADTRLARTASPRIIRGARGGRGLASPYSKSFTPRGRRIRGAPRRTYSRSTRRSRRTSFCSSGRLTPAHDLAANYPPSTRRPRIGFSLFQILQSSRRSHTRSSTANLIRGARGVRGGRAFLSGPLTHALPARRRRKPSAEPEIADASLFS
jgi:hypothetical protein